MSAIYEVRTANPEYTGKIAGVLFVEGKATLNEKSVEGLDRNLEETVFVIKDLGHKVTEIFKCSDCGQEFESKNALSGHRKVHAKEEKIEKE